MGEKRKIITLKDEDENVEKWSVTPEVYELLEVIYDAAAANNETLYIFNDVLDFYKKKFKAEKLEERNESITFDFSDC